MLADHDPASWERVIAMNLTGMFLCMKYEIREMMRRGAGAIVNISSAAGIKSSPDVGAAYNASKHGVVGLSKGAAVQYADKRIRINVLCPGLIRTPLSEKTLMVNEAIAAKVIARHPIARAGSPGKSPRSSCGSARTRLPSSSAPSSRSMAGWSCRDRERFRILLTNR